MLAAKAGLDGSLGASSNPTSTSGRTVEIFNRRGGSSGRRGDSCRFVGVLLCQQGGCPVRAVNPSGWYACLARRLDGRLAVRA